MALGWQSEASPVKAWPSSSSPKCLPHSALCIPLPELSQIPVVEVDLGNCLLNAVMRPCFGGTVGVRPIRSRVPCGYRPDCIGLKHVPNMSMAQFQTFFLPPKSFRELGHWYAVRHVDFEYVELFDDHARNVGLRLPIHVFGSW